MQNKSLYIRAHHPVRLCEDCCRAVREICAGRYVLRQTAETDTEEHICALCGRLNETAEYMAEKESGHGEA